MMTYRVVLESSRTYRAVGKGVDVIKQLPMAAGLLCPWLH
jgi:hypothetical protein